MFRIFRSEQPGQVKAAVIPAQDVVAQRGERGQVAALGEDILRRAMGEGHVEHDTVAHGGQLDAALPQVRLQLGLTEQPGGETEGQALVAPTGIIQEGIEIARQHLQGVVPEAAPVVFHPGPRRSDRDMAGQRLRLGLLSCSQGPVNRLPLVKLVITHTKTPSC